MAEMGRKIVMTETEVGPMVHEETIVFSSAGLSGLRR
jgi:hypothetical protein